MNDKVSSSANIPPLISVVVLNWNAFEDTHECLLSLKEVNYTNFQIIVVDNGSNDESPQQIEANHPEVKLVRCKINKGIAID